MGHSQPMSGAPRWMGPMTSSEYSAWFAAPRRRRKERRRDRRSKLASSRCIMFSVLRAGQVEIALHPMDDLWGLFSPAIANVVGFVKVVENNVTKGGPALNKSVRNKWNILSEFLEFQECASSIRQRHPQSNVPFWAKINHLQRPVERGRPVKGK